MARKDEDKKKKKQYTTNISEAKRNSNGDIVSPYKGSKKTSSNKEYTTNIAEAKRDSDGNLVSPYKTSSTSSSPQETFNKPQAKQTSDEAYNKYRQYKAENSSTPRNSVEEEVEYANSQLNNLSEDEKKSLDKVTTANKVLSALQGLGSVTTRDNPFGVQNKIQSEAIEQKKQGEEEFKSKTGVDDQGYQKYVQYAREVQNAEDRKQRQEQIKKDTTGGNKVSNAIAKGTLDVADLVVSPWAGLSATAEGTLGRLGYADPNAPVDTNSANYMMQNFTTDVEKNRSDLYNEEGGIVDNTIGKLTNKDLGAVDSFLYGTGMSMGKAAISMAMGGEIAGALGVTGKAANAVANLVTLPQFGTSSYATTLQQAQERGLSQKQAQATAIVSGAAEMVFEKLSVDHFWDIYKNSGAKAARNAIVNILAQAGIEGSEEVTTDIANEIADRIINKGQSEYEQNVKEYGKDKANKMFFAQLGQDFLGGAISGAVFGGFGVSANHHQAAQYSNAELGVEKDGKAVYTGQEVADKYAQIRDAIPEIGATNGQTKVASELKQTADLLRIKAQNNQDISQKERNDFYQMQSFLGEQYEADDNYRKIVDEYKKAKVEDNKAQGFANFNQITNEIMTQKVTNPEMPEEAQVETELRELSPMDNMLVEESEGKSPAYISGVKGEEFTPATVEEAQEYTNGKTYRNQRNVDENNPKTATATTNDGERVRIASIKNVKGEPYVTTDSGVTMPLSDVSLVNRNMQSLYSESTKWNNSQAYVDGYSPVVPVPQYIKSMENVYNYARLHGSQGTFANAIKNEPGAKFMEDGLKYMYEEGLKKAPKESRDKKGLSYGGKKVQPKVNNGERVSKQAKSLVENVAKKTQTEISLLDDEEIREKQANGNKELLEKFKQSRSQFRGFFNPNTNEINLNIDVKDERVFKTLIHEAMGEMMEAYAPEEVAELQLAIIDYELSHNPTDFYDEVRDYLQRYQTVAEVNKEEDVQLREAANEYVNDILYHLFTTEEGMKEFSEFVADKPKSVMDKFIEFIDNLIQGIKDLMGASYGENNHYKDDIEAMQRLRKMALDTWQTAIDNKLALENGETELKQASSLDVRNSINVEEADRIVSAAEKRFGTTNNFKYAGYIDTNGKLLDFSDGQKYRVMDHREISEVLDLPEDAGYSDGLIAFMNMGNIRMNEYGIDISVAPNKKQKSKLRDFFNSLDGEVTVDFSKENGDSAGSADYQEGTSSSRILNDLDSYFETNKVPEGNVRYSIEVDSKGEELSTGQKKFFNESKAVDTEQEVYSDERVLANVYHGTIREFYEFKKEFANAEGNIGKGYYFTNDPMDVDINYANTEGADLTNKLEQEAERLENEEGYEDLSHEEILDKLKDKYITSDEPITLECYLNIKNPVYISSYDGKKASAYDKHPDTYLFTEEDFDPGYNVDDFEDEDEYYQEVESFVSDEIEDILSDVYDKTDVYDTSGIADIVYDAYYSGGITFEDLKSKLNELYLEDEEGNLVANEVARQIVESLGYDGIIDFTPFFKFRNMDGIHSITTHYIIFNSNQAKLTSNENPTDSPDIRYSLEVNEDGKKVEGLADIIGKKDYNMYSTFINNPNNYPSFKKSSDGDYMLPVNNKLVYYNGNYNNPGISKIVVIDSNNEDEIDFVRSVIYATEDGTITKKEANRLLQRVFEERIFNEYVAKDYGAVGKYDFPTKRNKRRSDAYHTKKQQERKRFSIEVDTEGNKLTKNQHSLDVDYQKAYEENNTEEMDRLVRIAADENGYDSEMLYHGTHSFGFTQIDLEKMDDNMSFFATNRQSIASSYSSTNKTRDISESGEIPTENIVKELEATGRWKDIRELKIGDLEARYKYLREKFKSIDGFARQNFKELKERDLLDPYTDFSNMLAKAILEKNVSDREITKELRKKLNPLMETNFGISDYAHAVYNALLPLNNSGLQQNVYVLDGNPRVEVDIRRNFLPQNKYGMYKFYANTDSMLEVDGKGANWNTIQVTKEKESYSPEQLLEMLEDSGIYDTVSYSDGMFNLNGEMRDKGFVERVLHVDSMHQSRYETLSTREIAERAKNRGYEGVIIRNITDDGGRNNDWNHYVEPGDVYIFFDPQRQVKSADTVTYDENGNVIPLSERFNPDNPDIRFSIEVEDKISDIKKRAEKRFSFDQADLDLLDSLAEGQSYNKVADDTMAQILSSINNLYKGQEVGARSIQTVAKEIKEYTGSTISTSKLEEQLKTLFDYMQRADNELNTGEMFDMFKIVAGDVVDKMASEKVDDSFRDFMRTETFRLTDDQKKEVAHVFGSYDNFRKKYFGTLNIRNDATSTLDGLWNEITEQSFYGLDRDTPEAEQPIALVDFLDAMKDQPINNFGASFDELSTDVAIRILEKYFAAEQEAMTNKALLDNPSAKKAIDDARANMRKADQEFRKQVKEKYDEEVARLTKERDDAQSSSQFFYNRARDLENQLANASNEEDKKAIRKLQSELDKKEKALIKAKAQSKAPLSAYQEQLGRADEKRKIMQISNRLMKMVYAPTEKLHMPEEFREPIGEFLNGIDFITHRGDLNSIDKMRWQTRMDNLRHYLSELSSKSNATQNELNLAELLEDELLEDMERFTRDHAEDKKISRMSKDDLHKLYTILTRLSASVSKTNQTFANQNYTSMTALSEDSYNELVEMNDKNVGNGVMQSIKDFFGKSLEDPITYFSLMGNAPKSIFDGFRRGFDRFAGHVKESEEFKNKNLPSDIYKWEKEKHTFEVPEGELELTTAHIMSLYETYKRKAAGHHTYSGGFKVLYNHLMGYTSQSKRAYHLSNATLQQIFGVLTPEQIEIADKLQQFMANNCADWGNNVSMTVWGYKKFTEKDYFPMKVDSDSRATSNSDANIPNLYANKNMSASKELKEMADNPLIIEDIFDVFTEHVAKMATYDGMVLPQMDAMRWFNYKVKEVDGQGRNFISGTKQEINRIYGKAGIDYFINFIKGINGTEPKARGIQWLNFAIGRYKKLAVVAKVRVAIQQPTAIVRAYDDMEAKYLNKALVTTNPIKYSKIAKENSMLAWWKGQGYYESYTGKGLKEMIVGKNPFLQKLEDFEGWGAQTADDLAWGILYHASELEIKDKHPDLKGKEFTDAVVERFEDLVTKTQVVDTMLHRTDIMRNQGDLAKMVTSFMMEPLKTYNMLMRSFVGAARDKDKKAINKLIRTLFIYLLNNAILSAVTTTWDALRKDDDKTEYADKWLEIYRQTFADNMNPLNMIPVVKDGVETLTSKLSGQYYGSTDMSLEGIAKTGQFIAHVIKKANNEKLTVSDYGLNKEGAQVLSYITGVPIYNVWNDIEGVHNGFFKNWETKAPSDYQKLYDAFENDGDIQKEVKNLLEAGKDEATVKKQITNTYKQTYLDTTDLTEKANLKNKLIKAYTAAGDDREKAIKKIDKW